MTGQSLNQHLPLKKKNTTLYMALVIFPHNTGFLYLSTTKNLKKKKTLQFISAK